MTPCAAAVVRPDRSRFLAYYSAILCQVLRISKNRFILGLMNPVRRARIALGLSQSTVAEHLGCTQASISQWETGAHVPSLSRVLDLVRFLAELAYGAGRLDLVQSLLGEETMIEEIEAPIEEHWFPIPQETAEGIEAE